MKSLLGNKFLIFAIFLAILIFVINFVYENQFMVNRTEKIEESFENCDSSDRAKNKCWLDVTQDMLDEEEISTSISVLVSYSNKNPDFAKYCHDFMHLVGEEAYRRFVDSKEFQIGEDTISCAYGFYHGFMETLFARQKDVSLAIDFCNKVSEELSYQWPDPGQCHHGVGHGVAYDYIYRNYEKDPWEVIKEGISYCEELSEDQANVQNCFNGVIDGMGALVIEEEKLDSIDASDPYFICSTIEEQYKQACYSGLGWLVLKLNGEDFSKAIRTVSNIGEEEYRHVVVRTISGFLPFVIENNGNYEFFLQQCKAMGRQYTKECVRGVTSGFTLFSVEAEKGMIEAVNFCNYIDENIYKRACVDSLVDVVEGEHKSEDKNTICQKLEEDFSRCDKSLSRRYVN